MAETKVYPKGMITFAKSEKAPDWVLGTLVVTPQVLLDWCNSEGKEYLTDYKGSSQIKLQVTKGKDGKLQIAVDTYKSGSKGGSKSDDEILPF
jgi:hypothetical protein